MMNRRIFIFIFILTIQNLYSQTNIQILAKQSQSTQAKLFLYNRSETILVDSSVQVSPGLFRFSLHAGYTQGLYKLSIGKNISFNFIIASEQNIKLETVIYAAEDSLKSIESKENEVYFQYQRIKKKYSQQLWLLNSLNDYYSDSSNFHKNLNSESNKIQIQLYNESKSLAINNPDLFAASLILLELKSIPKTDSRPIKEFLKQNWWIDANLKDSRLVNSPALDSKVWGFIDLFFNDKLDKEQQDSSFIIGIKNIMSQDADVAIKDYFRKILLSNYLETDYDATTKYLYESAFDGLSEINLTPEEKNSFEIQGKNGVGTKAKDFGFENDNGSKVKFSKINAQYKLIVFWSMWCPHCTEMLPELYEIYKKFKGKGFEVIAVSIDDEITRWKDFISENKYDWINTIEPDTGKSKIISEYNVDGTPKLFLVDKDLTIISRPSNAKQLEAKLKAILK